MKCIEALNGSSAIGRKNVVKIASSGWSQRRQRSGFVLGQNPRSRNMTTNSNKITSSDSNGVRKHGVSRRFSGNRSFVDDVKGDGVKKVDSISIENEVVMAIPNDCQIV